MQNDNKELAATISAQLVILGLLAVLFFQAGCAVQAKMWMPDEVKEETKMNDKPFYCHFVNCTKS